MTTSPNELAVNIIRKFSSLTFASARLSPQVSGLRADPEAGRATAKALANLLTYTANQFNVGKNINDLQLAILANDLLKAYWYWRFDEFAYVLGQAIRGKWGTTYDRIDAPTINEWCAKYGAERELLLTVESEEQAKAYKMAEVNGPPADLTTPQARALRAQLEALPNEQLQKGLDHYTALATLTPAESLKLAVATEVAQERNRQAWATHMLTLFKSSAGKTHAERAMQATTQDHALSLALLRGDWQAAGFATEPSEEWLKTYCTPQVDENR